jgi:DNA-binding transcriptional LysR family regulator
VELRQLRFFVTLAEELHFGRAAAREHIVQSALSQQIQRLERELGVALVERSTHHVKMTAAGDILLVETRQILGHLERALEATRAMATTRPVIRVALGDPSFDAMSLVLGAVRDRHTEFIEMHQVEAGVPEQCRLLADGRLDVGIGRAAHAPATIASEVIRLDRLGVLVAAGHRLARRDSIAVTELADERFLFADEATAPEFNEFVREVCRTAGFTPTPYPGTVQSMLGAGTLLRELRCFLCAPRSCAPIPGVRWLPLVEPSYYPWSLLWRADTDTEAVRSVLGCARELSTSLGWTDTSGAGHTSALVGGVVGRIVSRWPPVIASGENLISH